MMSLLVRRVLTVFFGLAIAVLGCFAALRTSGDALEVMYGDHAMDPGSLTAVAAGHGLDRTIPEQLVVYGTRLLTGDFGQSLRWPDTPVSVIVGAAWPITAGIGLAALAVAVALGLAAGITMATWPRHPGTRLLAAMTLIGMSVPPVVVALASSDLLGVPPGWGNPAQILAPVLALGAAAAVPIAHTARALLLSAMRMDHVRTARAKGLAPWPVTARHALAGVAGPVIAHCGAVASVLLTATATIEAAFGIPGLAGIAVQAVMARDAAVAAASALILAAGTALLAIGMDIVHAWADPRPGR